MISVIIPVLNEAGTIRPCLARLTRQIGPHEIVVIYGGSRDHTLDMAGHFPGVRCLHCMMPGRGFKMNQEAAIAKDDILLFLHSDTLLPANGLEMIETVMVRADVVAGSFSLRFDHQHPVLRLLEWFSRVNHILFTYCDRGLFVARHIFDRMGGFQEIPMMEDVEIQKRLRQTARFVKIRRPVITSARRFLLKGLIRQ